MVRKACILAVACAAMLLAAVMARAEPMFGPARGPLFSPASALIEVSAPGAAAAVGGSLFAGRAEAGLFAPRAARALALSDGAEHQGPADARLRHLIARAEAGRDGYDAVQHGARVRPPRAPTDMRVSEIYAWISATPGQPHAIGRYQFIPATLRRLMRELGADPESRFSPDLQDRLADLLIVEAGYPAARAGTLSRHAFMNNLAKIWAGLPTTSGRSYYHGYAGNRATMAWAEYDRAMAEILPG